MISVILTTYQRPEKLAKAILSVLNQTFSDWELIVVHDEPRPSRTATTEDLSDLDSRMRSIYQPHTGIHAISKNVGTKAAKGEYISYLDDDVTWRPDHLQILYNELSRNSNLDLVYGDRWLHDESGTISDQVGIFSDYNPQALLVRNYIDTSDFLVKKQALIENKKTLMLGMLTN